MQMSDNKHIFDADIPFQSTGFPEIIKSKKEILPWEELY
jgi:hypothetical protein